MVFCEGDMSATIELTQPELFGQDEAAVCWSAAEAIAVIQVYYGVSE